MPRKRVPIFPLFEEVRRVTGTLTDAQFGKAIRCALSQYYGGELSKETDGMVTLAAAIMLEQASRYDNFREQLRENGLRPKNGDQQKEAKVSKSKQNEANGSNGKQSTPPIPSPIPIPSNTCAKAVQLLNDLSGSSFRSNTKSTQKLIAAREKDGYTLDDIETVIRHQCGLWGKDKNMSKYLRPETLFGSKFEGYLSDARKCQPQQDSGYVLAPLEDQWEVAMREGNYA